MVGENATVFVVPNPVPVIVILSPVDLPLPETVIPETTGTAAPVVLPAPAPDEVTKPFVNIRYTLKYTAVFTPMSVPTVHLISVLSTDTVALPHTLAPVAGTGLLVEYVTLNKSFDAIVPKPVPVNVTTVAVAAGMVVGATVVTTPASVPVKPKVNVTVSAENVPVLVVILNVVGPVDNHALEAADDVGYAAPSTHLYVVGLT